MNEEKSQRGLIIPVGGVFQQSGKQYRVEKSERPWSWGGSCSRCAFNSTGLKMSAECRNSPVCTPKLRESVGGDSVYFVEVEAP